MKAVRKFKIQDSNGNRFIIYAESSSDAILSARKKTTAKIIYINK